MPRISSCRARTRYGARHTVRSGVERWALGVSGIVLSIETSTHESAKMRMIQRRAKVRLDHQSQEVNLSFSVRRAKQNASTETPERRTASKKCIIRSFQRTLALTDDVSEVA